MQDVSARPIQIWTNDMINHEITLKPIAHIYTDMPDKFGIPRQSNLAPDLCGRIVMEEEFRDPNAFRGIEGYDYIWVTWLFEGVDSSEFRPMVRPPRLGGNDYRGVFATRSPFRPNPLGLSSLKLDKVLVTEEGPVLYVSGIDLRNGTPIYDIKPYLPYVDAHPEARGGFTDHLQAYELEVVFPEEFNAFFKEKKLKALVEILSQDPRPSYQKDGERVYGLSYDGKNVKFRVEDEAKTLTVISVE